MSSSRRPHGGDYLPGQGSPVSPQSNRPHGGTYVPGQAARGQDSPTSPVTTDLNELHAEPSQYELPTQVHIQELPTRQDGPVQQVPLPESPLQQPSPRQSPRQVSARQSPPSPLVPNQQSSTPQLSTQQWSGQPEPVPGDMDIRPLVVNHATPQSLPRVWLPESQPEALTKETKSPPYVATKELLPRWEPDAAQNVIDRNADVTVVIEYPPTYSNFLNLPARPLTRRPQNGRRNMFSAFTKYRWSKVPHLYKSPTIKGSGTRYRHRDSMGRILNRPAAERFPDRHDGKLTKLMVQTVEELYNSPSQQQHSWRRTYIRNIGPLFLRAAYWPFKNIPINSEGYTTEEKTEIALRWIPACVALFFVLMFPSGSGEFLAGGQYFPLPYKYWGTCKVARNPKEDVRVSRALHWNASTDDHKGERLLRPRFLMFLNDPTSAKLGGAMRMSDEDWNSRQPNESTRMLPYVFVSYTAEQFIDQADWDVLHQIGEKAARRAGVAAYWVGCSCMPGTKKELEEDVYRLSDVIRGAYSLVIAVGDKREKPHDTAELLLQWGSRMWTFPEALLSPNDKFIEIYTRDMDYNHPLQLTKKELPAWVWTDADKSREMMDHFSGSMSLSRLELVDLAMKYLLARSTEGYFEGDMAYALMGLLRRRPMVDNTDSQFQAVARLSLANDNDGLLERLICMLPKDLNQSWLKSADAWDVNLWDIQPTCQVAGIGNNDTVILDGCHAASIKWDKFEPVVTFRKGSQSKTGARFLVRLCPLIIILGGAYAQTGGIAVLFLVIGLIILLASPYLVKVMYSGKIWNQQAWIFGFEGYCDIGTIESLIYGYNMKRLTWSTCGSNLSRHSININDEWIGRDPIDDPVVRIKIEQAKKAELGQMRIFTLVDTFTMTVTLIECVRPPTAVLLCGSEGGMQRAVLCSYDWRSQTLYKETVVRMETQCLERISRIGRVSFGFWRAVDVGLA